MGDILPQFDIPEVVGGAAEVILQQAAAEVFDSLAETVDMIPSVEEIKDELLSDARVDFFARIAEHMEYSGIDTGEEIETMLKDMEGVQELLFTSYAHTAVLAAAGSANATTFFDAHNDYTLDYDEAKIPTVKETFRRVFLTDEAVTSIPPDDLEALNKLTDCLYDAYDSYNESTRPTKAQATSALSEWASFKAGGFMSSDLLGTPSAELAPIQVLGMIMVDALALLYDRSPTNQDFHDSLLAIEDAIDGLAVKGLWDRLGTTMRYENIDLNPDKEELHNAEASKEYFIANARTDDSNKTMLRFLITKSDMLFGESEDLDEFFAKAFTHDTEEEFKEALDKVRYIEIQPGFTDEDGAGSLLRLLDPREAAIETMKSKIGKITGLDMPNFENLMRTFGLDENKMVAIWKKGKDKGMGKEVPLTADNLYNFFITNPGQRNAKGDTRNIDELKTGVVNFYNKYRESAEEVRWQMGIAEAARTFVSIYRSNPEIGPWLANSRYGGSVVRAGQGAPGWMRTVGGGTSRLVGGNLVMNRLIPGAIVGANAIHAFESYPANPTWGQRREWAWHIASEDFVESLPFIRIALGPMGGTEVLPWRAGGQSQYTAAALSRLRSPYNQAYRTAGVLMIGDAIVDFTIKEDGTFSVEFVGEKEDVPERLRELALGILFLVADRFIRQEAVRIRGVVGEIGTVRTNIGHIVEDLTAVEARANAAADALRDSAGPGQDLEDPERRAMERARQAAGEARAARRAAQGAAATAEAAQETAREAANNTEANPNSAERQVGAAERAARQALVDAQAAEAAAQQVLADVDAAADAAEQTQRQRAATLHETGTELERARGAAQEAATETRSAADTARQAAAELRSGSAADPLLPGEETAAQRAETANTEARARARELGTAIREGSAGQIQTAQAAAEAAAAEATEAASDARRLQGERAARIQRRVASADEARKAARTAGAEAKEAAKQARRAAAELRNTEIGGEGITPAEEAIAAEAERLADRAEARGRATEGGIRASAVARTPDAADQVATEARAARDAANSAAADARDARAARLERIARAARRAGHSATEARAEAARAEGAAADARTAATEARSAADALTHVDTAEQLNLREREAIREARRAALNAESLADRAAQAAREAVTAAEGAEAVQTETGETQTRAAADAAERARSAAEYARQQARSAEVAARDAFREAEEVRTEREARAERAREAATERAEREARLAAEAAERAAETARQQLEGFRDELRMGHEAYETRDGRLQPRQGQGVERAGRPTTFRLEQTGAQDGFTRRLTVVEPITIDGYPNGERVMVRNIDATTGGYYDVELFYNQEGRLLETRVGEMNTNANYQGNPDLYINDNARAFYGDEAVPRELETRNLRGRTAQLRGTAQGDATTHTIRLENGTELSVKYDPTQAKKYETRITTADGRTTEIIGNKKPGVGHLLTRLGVDGSTPIDLELSLQEQANLDALRQLRAEGVPETDPRVQHLESQLTDAAKAVDRLTMLEREAPGNNKLLRDTKFTDLRPEGRAAPVSRGGPGGGGGSGSGGAGPEAMTRSMDRGASTRGGGRMRVSLDGTAVLEPGFEMATFAEVIEHDFARVREFVRSYYQKAMNINVMENPRVVEYLDWLEANRARIAQNMRNGMSRIPEPIRNGAGRAGRAIGAGIDGFGAFAGDLARGLPRMLAPIFGILIVVGIFVIQDEITTSDKDDARERGSLKFGAMLGPGLGAAILTEHGMRAGFGVLWRMLASRLPAALATRANPYMALAIAIGSLLSALGAAHGAAEWGQEKAEALEDHDYDFAMRSGHLMSILKGGMWTDLIGHHTSFTGGNYLQFADDELTNLSFADFTPDGQLALLLGLREPEAAVPIYAPNGRWTNDVYLDGPVSGYIDQLHADVEDLEGSFERAQRNFLRPLEDHENNLHMRYLRAKQDGKSPERIAELRNQWEDAKEALREGRAAVKAAKTLVFDLNIKTAYGLKAEIYRTQQKLEGAEGEEQRAEIQAELDALVGRFVGFMQDHFNTPFENLPKEMADLVVVLYNTKLERLIVQDASIAARTARREADRAKEARARVDALLDEMGEDALTPEESARLAEAQEAAESAERHAADAAERLSTTYWIHKYEDRMKTREKLYEQSTARVRGFQRGATMPGRVRYIAANIEQYLPGESPEEYLYAMEVRQGAATLEFAHDAFASAQREADRMAEMRDHGFYRTYRDRVNKAYEDATDEFIGYAKVIAKPFEEKKAKFKELIDEAERERSDTELFQAKYDEYAQKVRDVYNPESEFNKTHPDQAEHARTYIEAGERKEDMHASLRTREDIEKKRRKKGSSELTVMEVWMYERYKEDEEAQDAFAQAQERYQLAAAEVAALMDPLIDDTQFWEGTDFDQDALASNLDEYEEMAGEPLDVQAMIDYERSFVGMEFGEESVADHNGRNNVPGVRYMDKVVRGMGSERMTEIYDGLTDSHVDQAAGAKHELRILDEYGVFDDRDQWEDVVTVEDLIIDYAQRQQEPTVAPEDDGMLVALMEFIDEVAQDEERMMEYADGEGNVDMFSLMEAFLETQDGLTDIQE